MRSSRQPGPACSSRQDLRGSVRSICADIRDFQQLRAAIAECRPDVLIHLAAQSVVRRGYEDPSRRIPSNVMGTVHVLEALRQLGRPCVVVNVTSDKCYSNREWVWGYREDEAMGGRDPYSNSKGCAELVTSAYRDSFFPPASLDRHGIAVASARAGNAIGGGDWTSDQLIPDLMRAFLADDPCRIRNPSAIRPWQFVLEPLRGYLMLAERLGGRRCPFCWRLELWSPWSRRQARVLDRRRIGSVLGEWRIVEPRCGSASPGSPLSQVRRFENRALIRMEPTPSLTSGPRLDRGMVPRLSARGQS